MRKNFKITISLIALIMAFVTMTGTVFAWFTISDNLSVQMLEIEVTTDSDDLYIGVDLDLSEDQENVLYSKELSRDNLFASQNLFVETDENGDSYIRNHSLNAPVAFSDVTTANGEFYINRKDELATANLDYYSFKLYFRSTAEFAQNIYLFSEGSDIVPEGEYVPDAFTTIAPDEAAALAAAHGGSIESVYGNALSGSNTGNGYVYSRAAYATRLSFTGDVITDSVPQSIFNVWDPYNPSRVNNPSFFLGNLALDYFNMKNGTNRTDTTDYKPITTSNSKTEVNGATPLVTLVPDGTNNGYFVGTAIMNIWIEGNDGDCFNSILSDLFSVHLKFVALEVV